MNNGLAISGKMTANWLFKIPNFWAITNFEIMIVSPGMTNKAIIRPNRIAFPLKSNFAKAKPANEFTAIDPIVTLPA